MSGSGKSVTGALLAKTLDYNFTDLDIYIQEKDGLAIQEIINTQGKDFLLELEEKRLYEIDLNHRVVAPGGSIIYQHGLMEYLKKNAILVYLDEVFDNIMIRLKDAQDRGIVGYPEKSLLQIYSERQTLYSKYADITIHPEGRSTIQIVHEIIKRVNSKSFTN